MIESLLIFWHFICTRWLPHLPAEFKLRRFLRRTVRECQHYRGIEPELKKFPLMAKRNFLAHFTDLNRHHITLEAATAAALQAERERDFLPQLPGGVSVGLSSGTSGARHVFLVDRADRCRWAGQMLASMLSTHSLLHLINPLRPPLRIAFFLRANSNLYTTVRSRRVQFSYYDLTQPFAKLLRDLKEQQPHILIAPATVLAEIANHAADHTCVTQVISVAEVLDSRDRAHIQKSYHLPVAQIYQAAEGFLGATCRHGRIHLNEDSLWIERRWINESRDRFQPIITDFSRHAQWFVRHHLTDILRPSATPCPCGSRTTSLESIEGRAEEILWCRDAAGALQPVFPDSLRQALYSMPQPLDLYRVEQHGEEWHIHLRNATPATEAAVSSALAKLLDGLQLNQPAMRFLPWSDQAPDEKQKRFRCISPPS
ncbi:F390 synthetase-related protein [Prosthecobacter sp.]|uniref:F390 synthetase-related protein n=1 Tax=Prosthecobacter sp. TaxID=1965333 RepID=UPI0037852A9F